jgi:DNA-binding SARP family transcriptional activator
VQISFNILGRVTAELRTAEYDARPTELDAGPFKQRLLLALLLCRCNAMVLVEELIDALWWDGPPRTAHKNIQVYVTHLRKLLAEDGRPGRLIYHPSGYQLVLTSAEVDALRFEDLSRAGRLALRRGDHRGSAASMRQALGLWRGPALADLRVSPVLREEAARLDGRRVSVYEDWFEAELLLGNHAEVLEEIEAVVRAHPLRERLRSHQLTALYRGGRRAEALAEYDNLRQMLTAELGLDLSPALQRLYQGILSGHPALNAPPLAQAEEAAGPGGIAGPGGTPPPKPSPLLGGLPAPPNPPGPRAGEVVAHLSAFPGDTGLPGDRAPEQARGGRPAARPSGLPRAADDFTGRQDVIGQLLAFFGHGGPASSHLRRFAAVVGPPGAGTSTLALQAAHALGPRFRDGPLMLPLRDEKGAPRPSAELIDDLLGLLQPFPPPPVAVRDRSSVLRSRLADLQLLLILDGVAEEAQVRPLLPGAGDCSVILTSCRTLSGLEGVSRFPLGLFTEDEAVALLSRLIGPARVAQARPAARRIVQACGLLPLAVRIAGARLAGLGHLPLERFADRLEDQDRLLDELAVGDLSVRDRFDRYLRGLDFAERLALMLVAAAWGPTARGPSEMEQLLERLAGVHALTITDRGSCPAANPLPFAMPTPLWIYAQQLVSAAVGDARP